MTDANVGTLALGLDELYAFGQLNTDAEPVDRRFEPFPGIEVIVGDSLFTASKAANLPAVLGSAPWGTLFTVPHRHMLVALPITGPETIGAVQQLVAYTVQIVGDGLVPGGVISPDVHFSRDGIVSRVSSTTPDGRITLHVDARLQHALETATTERN
ncbi:hypothetical protein [Herbiconiux liukaitaii]|uniref:hypothetical protein n=1 Tax=Herbiconiux liukaitaii TaxID=3342799 RepID=UPI0035BA10C0